MNKIASIIIIRNSIQILFALFLLKAGWDFYRFVSYFEGKEEVLTLAKPAAVEGLLPISALIAFKQWLFTGHWDIIHPAGLAIFLAIIIISILWKRGFCSWLCPIGTLSEFLHRLGKAAFGKNYNLPKWLDRVLLVFKYLILGFFVKVIFIDFDLQTAKQFLASPYNMIADVKMLKFFLNLSLFAFKVIISLVIASIFVPNFWCRYGCPYGALLGVLNLFSPTAITRNQEACTNCYKCNNVCSNGIKVAEQSRVWSPECTMCLNCTTACSKYKALSINVVRKKMSHYIYPLALLGTFIIIIYWAKITGKWESSIPTKMYEILIPMADKFNH